MSKLKKGERLVSKNQRAHRRGGLAAEPEAGDQQRDLFAQELGGAVVGQHKISELYFLRQGQLLGNPLLGEGLGKTALRC